MAGWLRRLFGGSGRRARGTERGHDLLELRHKVLSMRRAEVGMETGFEGGSATLVALSAGTTSLYLSSGGGVLGGGTHEPVRQANASFRRAANQSRTQMTPTDAFPLPDKGRVLFYALSDAGVSTAAAPEEALAQRRHALSPLFFAGHAVITALREMTEGRAPEVPPADVNQVPEGAGGITRLMVAAHAGRPEALEELIRRGADLEARDDHGYTALMMACNAGQAACVSALIAAGAAVDARDHDGSTPLMFAAQHGRNEIVSLLLGAGADPDITGTHGLSAIGFARQNRLPETLRLLTPHSRTSR